MTAEDLNIQGVLMKIQSGSGESESSNNSVESMFANAQVARGETMFALKTHSMTVQAACEETADSTASTNC